MNSSSSQSSSGRPNVTRTHAEAFSIDEDSDDASSTNVLLHGYPLSVRGKKLVASNATVMHAPLPETLESRLLCRSAQYILPAVLAAKQERIACGADSAMLLAGSSRAEMAGHDIWRNIARYLRPQEMGRLAQCSSNMCDIMSMMLCEWRAYQAPMSSPSAWTDEQRYAYEHVIVQKKSLFITGPAGAGKSVLMRWLMHMVIAYTDLSYKAAAPTGIVAVPMDGQTLHSFLKLGIDIKLAPPGVRYDAIHAKPHKIKDLALLDILFIDEPGMISDAMLRYIDDTMRLSTGLVTEPFGGVCVVFCGDFSQLPPITKGLRGSTPRTSAELPYGFRAPQWVELFGKGKNTMVLNRSFRQQDVQFASLLERVRNGTSTQADLTALHALVPAALKNADPPSEARLDAEWNAIPAGQRPRGADANTQWKKGQRADYAQVILSHIPNDYVIITGMKNTKEVMNAAYLERLPGTAISWKAENTGHAFTDKGQALPKNLKLKVDAIVMLSANSTVLHHDTHLPLLVNGVKIELANGTTGTVKEIVRTYDRAHELFTSDMPVVASRCAFTNWSLSRVGVDGLCATFHPAVRYVPAPSYDPRAQELHNSHGKDPVPKYETQHLIVVHFPGPDIAALVYPTECRLMRQHIIVSGDDDDGATGDGGGAPRTIRQRVQRTRVYMICRGSRVQFPLYLARAITSHKSQGKTLRRAAVTLNECFTVGQPYVMLSRVRAMSDLIILNHRFGRPQFADKAARDACAYQSSLLAGGTQAAIFGPDGQV